MGEHDALGEPRGARSVLHHDHVIVVELAAGPFQIRVRPMLPQQDQLGHAVEAPMLLRAHVDEVLQVRIGLRAEEAARLLQGFRHQVTDDLEVIHIPIGIYDAERLHVRLLENVVYLMALVDRVHRDHDDAHLRRSVHEGEPVRDVACPHAQMVPRLHADGHEPLGQGVRTLIEVLVGPAQVTIWVHDEFVVRVLRHLFLEVIPYGEL